MDPGALARSLVYIQAHLDGDLSLDALAAVAECSAPYFARRFSAMVGESPKQYTSRLRLERAALRLILLEDRILDVALDCGFANHETFSRAFRRRFGVAPLMFRERGRPPAGRPPASAGPELRQRACAAGADGRAPGRGVSLSGTVVRTLQPMSLAFIRHTGPYEQVPVNLWDALLDWARRHGRLAGAGQRVLLGIAHDAPGITAAQHLRFDAAIRVAGEFRAKGRGRIAHQRFPGGLFAFTTCIGPLASLPAAYQEVFRRVGADRSLVCVGLPCLEFYRVNRIASDLAIVETEIAVPVRLRR